MYASKAGATTERIVADACDAFWNRDARKAAARIKRIIAYACDAIRNCHAHKVGAIIERTVENISAGYGYRFQRRRDIVGIIRCTTRTGTVIILLCFHTTGIAECTEDISEGILVSIARRFSATSNKRKRDALQRRATRKCRRADAGDAIRDYYTRKAGATIERPIADACDAIGDCHAREAGATVERITTNAFYTIGDDDRGEAGAIRERRRADACDTISDCHAHKAGATPERSRADAGDAIWNNQLCYKFSVKI